MMNDEKDEIDLEEEEKKILFEYIKMQNEALKRIYENAIDKDNEK